MIASAALGLDRLQAMQRASRVDQLQALINSVRDGAAAISRGDVQAVGHGPAEIRTAGQARQPVLDAHQAADIARVAIGIPAAGIDDHQRTLEVVIAIKHREDHQAVIGHHVAVAAINVVAITLCQQLAPFAPVRLLGMPFADVVDHGVDDRVLGDDRLTRVDELVDVGFDEGLRFHGRQALRAIDRLAAVADAARPACQVRRQLRIARRHHGPAVDEDLRADLLGDYLAIQADRAALGRLITLLQPQISGVLGGIAHAAPPEHGLLFDQVV